jgi:hypothetical protein
MILVGGREGDQTTPPSPRMTDSEITWETLRMDMGGGRSAQLGRLDYDEHGRIRRPQRRDNPQYDRDVRDRFDLD